MFSLQHDMGWLIGHLWRIWDDVAKLYKVESCWLAEGEDAGHPNILHTNCLAMDLQKQGALKAKIKTKMN